MTVVNDTYEFTIEENKVYKIRRVNFTNVAPAIQISGTGSINLYGSLQVPTSYDDPCFTLNSKDSNLLGYYAMYNAYPNFIKAEPSEDGERTIILSGFYEPEEIIFE